MVIVRFSFSPLSRPPLIFSRLRRYTLPFESTTCQCGAGVSGILNSSDQVRVSLFPDRPCVAMPLLALTPSNFAVVCTSAANPFDATNSPVAATRHRNPILNKLCARITPPSHVDGVGDLRYRGPSA